MIKRIASFDVFDTCLVRNLPAPSDVFWLVGQKLQARMPLWQGESFLFDFVAARVEAERRVRRIHSTEEVTLEQIWQVLLRMLQGTISGDSWTLELEAEEACLRPNVYMQSEIQEARAQGLRVVFVSDTYLPETFVKSQLFRHHFADEGDGFFISSRYLATKASGSLFKIMLEAEDIRAINVTHMGDNPRSDVEVPSALGIATRLVTTTRLTPHEESCLRSARLPDDFAARLVGQMRTFRLACNDETSRIARSFVADFLGPFTLTFCAWLLAQNKCLGIRRLYFLSRDGYLLRSVAEALAAGTVECRYLYVSRQALFLPSVTEVSPEGMPWLWRSFEKPTLNRLLAKLEFSWEDVGGSLKMLANSKGPAYELRDARDWGTFWEWLRTPAVEGNLKERIRTRQAGAVAYLEQEGLLGDVPCAVVDLGWFLSCQKALLALLRMHKPNASLRGLYLGLQQGRHSEAEAGPATSLFNQPAQDSPRRHSWEIWRRVPLIEHVVGCAPHGTVHHYDETGRPVLQSQDRPNRSLLGLLHALTIGYAQANARFVAELSDANVAAATVDALVRSAFAMPDHDWAALLGGVRCSEDQNNLHSSPLASPLSTWRVAGSLLPATIRSLAGMFPRRPVWPEGDMAVSSRIARLALRVAGTCGASPYR